MPPDEPYLTPDAHWKRLFSVFKALRATEPNIVLQSELHVAEHKLRLAYTLENYPEEANR